MVGLAVKEIKTEVIIMRVSKKHFLSKKIINTEVLEELLGGRKNRKRKGRATKRKIKKLP